jgi:hypothetical protein
VTRYRRVIVCFQAASSDSNPSLLNSRTGLCQLCQTWHHALGSTTLCEFDFEETRGDSYEPALSLR